MSGKGVTKHSQSPTVAKREEMLRKAKRGYDRQIVNQSGLIKKNVESSNTMDPQDGISPTKLSGIRKNKTPQSSKQNS